MDNLYVDKSNVVYRIFDPVEQRFCCSGRGLYSQNGRSVWMSANGVNSALRNMPKDIKDRLVIKKYFLIDKESVKRLWKNWAKNNQEEFQVISDQFIIDVVYLGFEHAKKSLTTIVANKLGFTCQEVKDALSDDD